MQKDARGIITEQFPVGESKMMPFDGETLANVNAKWLI